MAAQLVAMALAENERLTVFKRKLWGIIVCRLAVALNFNKSEFEMAAKIVQGSGFIHSKKP